MIMGSGKTTVIGPMVALLLADGKGLVIQVVPDQLLDMSTNVMRNAFGTVAVKNVVTLTFSRNGPTDNWLGVSTLLQKLRRVREEAGIVCSTPNAVKSLLLKFLDTLAIEESLTPLLLVPRKYLGKMTDGQRNKLNIISRQMVKMSIEADKARSLLQLLRGDGEGAGKCMIDEVDMVLHTLKSELNFPVGAKEPLDLSPERWNLPMHLFDGVYFACGRDPLNDASFTEMALKNLLKGNSSNNQMPKPQAGVDRDEHLTWLSSQPLADIIKYGLDEQAIIKTPHLVILEKSFYRKAMRWPMARWAAKWLMAQRVVISCHDDAREANPRDDFTAAFELAIVEYASGGLTAPRAASSREPLTIEPLVAKHPRVRQLLNLAKTWVVSLLAHSLSKRSRVEFGLLSDSDQDRLDQIKLEQEQRQTGQEEESDEEDNDEREIEKQRQKETRMSAANLRSRDLLAVPFVGKDVPSQGSEFSSPEVAIGMTINAFRIEGMREVDLKVLVTRQLDAFAKESGPPEQRRAYQQFEDWRALGEERRKLLLGPSAPKVELLTLEMIQPKEKPHMDAMMELLSRVPAVANFYLASFVFRHTQSEAREGGGYAVKKLSASGADIGSDCIFGVRLGFSGTPSNLIPRAMRPCQAEPGSDGKVITKLTDAKLVTDVRLMSIDWDVDTLLTDLATEGFLVLIDTGAIITGYTNEGVARFVLRQSDKLKAAVFLDPQDRKMAVNRSGGPAFPFEQLGCGLDERFTFFDQYHTTGMDIKQHPSARAAVLLGKGMSLRDHAQGCWRMRGLDIGQTLGLFVVPEVAKMIKDAAGKGEGCWASDDPSKTTDTAKTKRVREMLHDVMTWLMINGHENEKLQKGQLDMQGARSSVRSPAVTFLLSDRANMPQSQPARMDWSKAKLLSNAPFVDEEATPREILDELEHPCFESRFGTNKDELLKYLESELLDTDGILGDLASRLRLSKSALKEENPKYEVADEAEAALRMTEALRELPRDVRLMNWHSDYHRHSIALVPFVEQWGIGSRYESLCRDELPEEMVFEDERKKRKLRELHDRMRNAESQRLRRALGQKLAEKLKPFQPRDERRRQREEHESSERDKREARRLKAFGTVQTEESARDAERASASPTRASSASTPSDLATNDVELTNTQQQRSSTKGGTVGTEPLTDESLNLPGNDMEQYRKALEELQQAAHRDKVLASDTVATIENSLNATRKALEEAKRAKIGEEVPELKQLQGRLDEEEKVCLRAKRRQASEEILEDEARRYKIGTPLDDGKYSLLTGCLRVFQESLASTLNVADELGGGKRHEQALEEELDRFQAIAVSLKATELEQAERNEINEMKEQRAKVQAAMTTSQKGEDEASGLDSEMVQEQEAELEKEQHDFGPFDTTLTDGESPWKLASLLSLLEDNEDPTFSLDRLRPHGAAQVIKYPQGALRFSPNFASPDYDKLTRRRLRTANAILVIPREREGDIQPATKGAGTGTAVTARGPKRQYVLMTLAEAEAVLMRRDLLASVPGCDILTLDGFSLLRHRKELDNVHDDIEASLHREMIQLLRFWSSHAFYTHEQLERLLEGLHRVELLQASSGSDDTLAHRKAAFIASSECRRRDRFDTANTPVEVVFTLASARDYTDLVKFAGDVRHSISKRGDALLKGENGFKQIFEAIGRPAADVTADDDNDDDGSFSPSQFELPVVKQNHDAPTEQIRLLNAADIRQNGAKLRLDTELVERVAKRLDNYEFENFARDLAVPIANAMMIEAQKAEGEASGSGLGHRIDQLIDGASRLPKPYALALLIASESSATGPTPVAAMRRGGSHDWRAQRESNVIVPKHLVPQEVASIGHLFLASGARVNVFANNLVQTDAGRRPTLVPRGVRLKEGLWYYEVEIIQPSSGGFAAIGWVNSRWNAEIEGHGHTGSGSGPHGVGTDAHSWGLTAALHKKHLGIEEQFDTHRNASLRAGDVVGCIADIAGTTSTLSFTLNGSTQRLGVAYRGNVITAHGLTPAVTIEFGFQCRINFGERPFRHSPTPSAGASGLSVPLPVLVQVSKLRLGALNTEDAMGNDPATATTTTDNDVSTARLWPTTGLCFVDTARLADSHVVSKYNYGCASVVLRDVLLTTGKWYFEVKGSDWGGFRVGFVTESFTGERGTHTIGDDKQSWALAWQSRGRARGALMHHGRTKRLTAVNLRDRWIGVALDLTAHTIKFVLPTGEPEFAAYYHNQPYHVSGAVEFRSGFEGVIAGTGLIPAIGVKWKCDVDVNFGDKFIYTHDQVPELGDYRPVSDAIAEGRRANPSTTPLPPTLPLVSKPLRDGIRLVALSGAEHVIFESDRCARYVGGEGFLASVKAAGVHLGIGKWYYEVTVENVGGLGRSSAFQLFDAETDGDGGGRGDEEDNFEPPDISDKNTKLPPIGGRGAIGFVTEQFFGAYDQEVGVGDTRDSWSISGANPMPDDDSSFDDEGATAAVGSYKPWVEVRHNRQRLTKQNIEPLRFALNCGGAAGPDGEEALMPHEFKLTGAGPDGSLDESDVVWRDGDRKTTIGCAVSIDSSKTPDKLEIRIDYSIKHRGDEKVWKVSASRRESAESPKRQSFSSAVQAGAGDLSQDHPEEFVALINDDDVLVPAVSLHPNLKLSFNFGEKSKRGLPSPEYSWVIAAVTGASSSSAASSASSAASSAGTKSGGGNSVEAELVNSTKQRKWKEAEFEHAKEKVETDTSVPKGVSFQLVELGEKGKCKPDVLTGDGTLLRELLATNVLTPGKALQLDRSALALALPAVTEFLQRCPYKVHAISADTCELNAEGVVPLARFLEDDKSVRAVSLEANVLLVDGAARFAEVLRHNSTITALNLGGNMIADDGVSAICGALHPRRSALRELWLRKSRITDAGALFLATLLRQYDKLEVLDLGENDIYARGAKNLAQEIGGGGGGGRSAGGGAGGGGGGGGSGSGGLKRLHLEHNSIGDEGLEALADALRHNRVLTALRLGSGNNIDGAGATALARALSANRLSGVRELTFDEPGTPMAIQAQLLFALRRPSTGGEAINGLLFGRVLYDQHERSSGDGRGGVSHQLHDMLDEHECSEFFKRPLTYCALRCVTHV